MKKVLGVREFWGVRELFSKWDEREEKWGII